MEEQPHKNTMIYVENPFSLKGKTTGQTPNNFTILNRYYNTQRYNLSKEKFSFSFHSLLSSSLCISHNFLLLSLFFSSFTCSHSHSLQDCTVLNVGTSDFFFLYHKWPNGLSILFLSPFLLFLLPHSSHHITINASHLL